MINQDYTFKDFSRLVVRGDYFTYFKTIENTKSANKDKKEKLLNDIIANNDFNKYVFSTICSKKRNGKKIYCLEKFNRVNYKERLTDDFILRRLNQIIKKTYDVQQANRFHIVKTVQTLLESRTTFYVYKTDVNKFYESINKQSILNSMNDSALLSYTTKSLLKSLFENNVFTEAGLPRGINISATLAEYYMRKFDSGIRRIDGIFFYARYVDDIIIFSTKEINTEVEAQIQKLLPEGLSLNSDKSKILTFSNSTTKKVVPSFDFLGYQFSRYKKSTKNGGEFIFDVDIVIAPKKIQKIKTKIIKCLLDFRKTKDFALLKDRLLFLTANYPLQTARQKMSKYEKVGALRGGIAYSYPIISNTSCLKHLDTFLYQAIQLNMCIRLNIGLTDNQKKELRKYSFVGGFCRHITRRFKLERLKQIKLCWND